MQGNEIETARVSSKSRILFNEVCIVLDSLFPTTTKNTKQEKLLVTFNLKQLPYYSQPRSRSPARGLDQCYLYRQSIPSLHLRLIQSINRHRLFSLFQPDMNNTPGEVCNQGYLYRRSHRYLPVLLHAGIKRQGCELICPPEVPFSSDTWQRERLGNTACFQLCSHHTPRHPLASMKYHETEQEGHVVKEVSVA